MIEETDIIMRTHDDNGKYNPNIVIIKGDDPEKLKRLVLQNQELRKQIVDLADIWDGQESGRYGDTLQKILNDLEIKEMPEFYEKENIERVLKEMEEAKTNRQNAEKARKYDDLMNANSEVVQHNIDITREHQIVNRLKEHEGCEGQDSAMCCLDRHKEEILGDMK